MSFLQNHDQVGNRAFGERIGRLGPPERIRAALAILLLAPQPPLLFMGEEWGAREPFPFFCDFEPDLARKVAEGRRGEFARFDRFRDETARLLIPDPNAATTFDSARLDWEAQNSPEHAEWLALYRRLLALREREIAPRLRAASAGTCLASADGLLAVRWTLGDGSRLHLTANLQDAARTRVELPVGRLLYTTSENLGTALTGSALPAWTVVWTLIASPEEGSSG